MAYWLETTGSIDEEVRRVILEQIERALAEVHNSDMDQSKTVHQVRKRCKKIRGLLHLVRYSLADPKVYAFENAHFRDAAQDLSALRDTEAILEAYDILMDSLVDDAGGEQFAQIRRSLVRQREPLSRQERDVEARRNQFCDQMIQARARATSWQVNAEDYAAVAGCVKRTYRRGRRALTKAYEDLRAKTSTNGGSAPDTTGIMVVSFVAFGDRS